MWVIIVGTIFSFVYFLSPTARNGGGGGSSGPATFYGSVNGEPITQLQFELAGREAKLVFRMSQGRWPTREQEDTLKQIAYQRLFIAAKLKELNIEVTPEAAARYTRQMLGVPDGQVFPKDKFAEFVSKELNQAGQVSLEDFDRYVRLQVGQQLLISLFGMNGQLITQKEAEFFYRRENESMTVELARFQVSNYVDKVAFTPQDLQEFYTNRQSDYRLPPREQVNYIRFEPTNYLAVANQTMSGMSNLDAYVDQIYSSQDSAAFKDEAGAPLTEAAAKAKIKTEILPQMISRKAAQTNANDVATKLADGHDKDHPITLADLQKLAETNGLTVTTTEPFDEKNPPKDLQLSPGAMSMVFQLELGDPDDQYKLMGGSNGYYLVGLQQKYPSESQSFETVRAKVTEDYRAFKALDMVKEAGAKFAEAAKKGLAVGEPFDFICTAQGVKPEVLSPFSAVTPSIPEIEDREDFSYVVRVVYELAAGQASSFVAPTEAGGFVAYVKARAPMEDALVQRDIPAYLEKFRRDRQIAAFNQWLQREMRSHVVMVEPAKTGPLS
jgi:hypothetical protein